MTFLWCHMPDWILQMQFFGNNHRSPSTNIDWEPARFQVLVIGQQIINFLLARAGFTTFLSACMLSLFSHVWLFATLWTAALQAPLSMGFSRQEYWSGLHAHISYVSCIGRQVLHHECHLGSPLYFLSHSYYSAGLLAIITVSQKGRQKTTVCFPNKVGAASRCDGATSVSLLQSWHWGEWDIRLQNNKSRSPIKLFEEACFPGGSEVKVSACNAGDAGSIPGSGRSPEKEMATRSSTLAWEIPWTEEPGGLQSTGSQRVGHDWAISLFYPSYKFWCKLGLGKFLQLKKIKPSKRNSFSK